MTKRKVETDLDDLNDELLDDLSHRERYALLLKAHSEGRDRWREQLVETIPMSTYRGGDPEYQEWGVQMTALADWAVYRLHTLMLKFRFAQHLKVDRELFDLFEDSDTEDEPLFSAQEDGPDSIELFEHLYICYHKHRRFAEQVAGLDIDVWAVIHPEGEYVVEQAAKFLDLYSEYIEQANEITSDLSDSSFDLSKSHLPDELPEERLDRRALFEFDQLVDDFVNKSKVGTGAIGYLGV